MFKEEKSFKQSTIEKTHKKNDSYDTFNHKDINNLVIEQQTSLKQKSKYELLLTKLDQAEEKLMKS